MSLVPFEPVPGLVSDKTSFAAGAAAWIDCDNVRFRLGKAQAIGESLTNGPTLGSSSIKDIFAFTRSAVPTFAFGGGLGIYVGSLSSAPDRSPAAFSAASGWSFAAWGGTLLACARGGKLYEQSGTSAATEVLPAPDQITQILVTSERQVLAFGCNEEASGTFNALCIRGSDIEDYTDWTTTSTNNAFEHILDGSGAIIAAHQVGQFIGVWTTTTLYLGQFLGDPGQTYRFENVAAIACPMTARAVDVYNGVAYWMGRDHQLYSWIPGSAPQTISCPILEDFRTNCRIDGNQGDNFITRNSNFAEIWFHYLDTRDLPAFAPTRYIAYSLAESEMFQRPVWFRGSLALSAALDDEIVREAASARSGEDTSIIAAIFGQAQIISREMASQCLPGYIQSAAQSLSNSGLRMMIRRFVPDFEGLVGNIDLTLYCQDQLRGTAVTKGPYTISDTSTKVDFRASGKIISVKLGNGGGVWRLGKPLFDVVPMGER